MSPRSHRNGNGWPWPCSRWPSSSSSSTRRSSTSRCRRSAATSSFSQDEPLLGRQRLHAHLRRLPAARRPPGRPARPPPHVHGRPRPVRASPRCSAASPQTEGQLIAARAVQGLGAALLSPAALSIVTDDLHRGRRAQQGARRLGRRGRLRRRRRRAARRRAHRVGRLGVGPVRQRPDRAVGRAAGAAPAAREPRRGRAPLRRRRRGLGHRRPVARSSTRWSTPTSAGWGSTQTLGLLALAAGAARRVRRRSSSRAAHPLVPFSIFRLRTLRGVNVVGAAHRRCRCSRCSSSSRSTCSRCSATSALKAGLAYLPLAVAIIVSAGRGLAAGDHASASSRC